MNYAGHEKLRAEVAEVANSMCDLRATLNGMEHRYRFDSDVLADGMEYAVSEQDTRAVLARMGGIPEEQQLESGVSASAVMDLIEQVKEAVSGVVAPVELLETLLITAEQALWHREWAARDENHPVPESVTRRLADAAKVRALLKK